MDQKSIYSIERISINNIEQSIMIRSDNIENPVLVYFHGGPGTSELPLLRHNNSNLEKSFTLIYLEQRGAGKTFNYFDNKNLNIDQFVDDGYQLTLYCLKRFRKEKVILVGHSWGTIISTKLALKYPDFYYAYIGIGQEVCPSRGEKLGYDFILREAEKENNVKALAEIKKINTPGYLTIINNPNWFEQLKIQRKWLTYYGGDIRGEKNYSNVIKIYTKSKEYSLLDLLKFGLGSNRSIQSMWPEIMNVDFINDEKCFQIPVFFIQGKFDYVCPGELVREYFDKITSPNKQMIYFENSAHNPIFEESNRFYEVILDIADICRSNK